METAELEKLINKGLQAFYERRLQKVKELKLKSFVCKKNPYLFRALGIQKASEIVERLMTDFISSSDESIFGDAFFEPIARIASGGMTADGAGVDLIIESDDRIKAIAIKSGPNPYNSSQVKRQSQEFQAIRNRLYKIHKQFDPILGHSYGRKKSNPTSERIYRDSSGQVFWQEITGDSDFYLKLIRLMKDQPAKHREEYKPAWDAAVNRFTAEFIKDFCFPDGNIDWEKLVKLVSEEKPVK
jgi:hypothetical protein